MNEYFPLIVVGAIIGVISIIFVIAYALIKNKKKQSGSTAICRTAKS